MEQDTRAARPWRTLIPLGMVAPLLIIASEAFLVLSGTLVKWASESLPSLQIVFGRNALALAILLPWIIYKSVPVLKTQVLHLHFMRAFVGVSAMSCMFYAWGHLPLAQAALFKQTAPFFVPFIAFFWLGEQVSRVTKLAILVGFVGVVMVLNPAQGEVNIAAFVALLGASLGALAKVTIRRMHVSESTQTIVFYFALFSTLIMLLPALYVWQPMAMGDWALLSTIALTSTIAQLLLSKAYGMEKAGVLAPFTYSSVVIAAVLGWVFWSESLGWIQWLGMLVIAFGGLAASNALPFKRWRKASR